MSATHQHRYKYVREKILSPDTGSDTRSWERCTVIPRNPCNPLQSRDISVEFGNDFGVAVRKKVIEKIRRRSRDLEELNLIPVSCNLVGNYVDQTATR